MSFVRRLFPILCLIINGIYNSFKEGEKELRILKFFLNVAFFTMYMNKLLKYVENKEKRLMKSDSFMKLFERFHSWFYLFIVLWDCYLYLFVNFILKTCLYMSLLFYKEGKVYIKNKYKEFYRKYVNRRSKQAFQILLFSLAFLMEKNKVYFYTFAVIRTTKIKDKRLEWVLLISVTITTTYFCNFSLMFMTMYGLLLADKYLLHLLDKVSLMFYFIMINYYSYIDMNDIILLIQIMIIRNILHRDQRFVKFQFFYSLIMITLVSVTLLDTIYFDEMEKTIKNITYIMLLSIYHRLKRFRYIAKFLTARYSKVTDDFFLYKQSESFISFIKTTTIAYLIIFLRQFDFLNTLIFSIVLFLDESSPKLLFFTIILQKALTVLDWFNFSLPFSHIKGVKEFVYIKKYYMHPSTISYSGFFDLLSNNLLGCSLLIIQTVLFSLLINETNTGTKKILKISRVS